MSISIQFSIGGLFVSIGGLLGFYSFLLAVYWFLLVSIRSIRSINSINFWEIINEIAHPWKKRS